MKSKILINLILLVIIFFAIDYTVFKIQTNNFNLKINYFENMTRKIAISKKFDKDYLNNIPYRKPLNISNGGGYKETKTNKSIVYTGCSFIYGEGLKEEETVSYKTSLLLKNPIYNLGLMSKAVNTLLGMIQEGIFFEKVQIEPAIIIYNYADFQLLRLVMPNMPFEGNEFMYKIKENKLVRKKPPFIISRFPLLCLFREHLFQYRIENDLKYKEYLKKFLYMHFMEVKKLINNKWPDTKFILTVYYNSPIFEGIAPELEKEGFIIIRFTEDEFGINTADEKFLLPDGHPNAKVWEIITPQLIEKIKPYLREHQ